MRSRSVFHDVGDCADCGTSVDLTGGQHLFRMPDGSYVCEACASVKHSKDCDCDTCVRSAVKTALRKQGRASQ